MNISTDRVETFSDSVIAILITIMVFDIKFRDLAHDFNHRDVIDGFRVLTPKLIAYAFAFAVVGILWLNHHHFFHLLQVVDEKLLWLNMLLLFWMSLIPLPTSMIGKNPLLPESSALFGGILLMASLSFSLMRRYAARHDLLGRRDPQVDREIRRTAGRIQIKNYIGLLCYLGGALLAWVSVFISFALYLIPSALFFIPDGVEQASDDAAREDEHEKSAS